MEFEQLVSTYRRELFAHCYRMLGSTQDAEDAVFDEYKAERLRAADTLLLGRRSFEGFEGYWPPVADDPSADATNREISRLNGAIDKVVVSDGLGDLTGPWAGTTEVVRRAGAHARIAELKRRPGGEILMFGSRTLAPA